MVTLFAALQASANALKANSQALAITEANINNMSVSGYARQTVNLTEDAFDPSRGLIGGVRSGDPQSARSQFAEQSVWWQENQSGFYKSFMQQANGISQLLGLNDVSGSTGIGADLANLFRSFSDWTSGPQTDASRNAVIERAREFAATISSSAAYLRESLTAAQAQIHTKVGEVNQIVGEISRWNQQITSGATPDAGAETEVYSRLEQLSALVPISTIRNHDGTMSILLGGQTPLLMGNQQNAIADTLDAPGPQSTFPQASPASAVVDSQGNDITASISGGALSGLLDYVNTFVPSLIGSGEQQGALNRLAKGLADSVNNKLGSQVQLFQYNVTDPTDVAQSLEVNPAVTAADLAAAQNANPGLPQNLAQIAGGTDPKDRIDGQTYTNFLSGVLQGVAGELSERQDGLDLHDHLLTQAQTLRDNIQGVSLEEETVNLLQYQRAFEAASRVIHVIDDLTQTAISLIPPA